MALRPFDRRFLPLVLAGPGLVLLAGLWIAGVEDGLRRSERSDRPNEAGASPSDQSREAGSGGNGIAVQRLSQVVHSSSDLVAGRRGPRFEPRDDPAPGPAPPAGGKGVPGKADLGAGLDARDFETLEPRHQEMVMRLLTGENEEALRTADGPVLLPEVCFSPATRPEIVRSFAAARQLAETRRFGGVKAAATQLGSRWTVTSSVSSGFSRGDPTTLTWSIVPDGINIPGGGSGESASPSNLRAWLDARYGSEAVWLPLFVQVFQRWTDLSGVTYHHAPHDDGASFPSSPGLLGVRGDIRISGHEIDGNFNVLAYNYFPQQGDMVLDTADSFFADTADNSRKLRTVVAHEAGHGVGLEHVCPVNASKLMEPFVSSTLITPQVDDIYSVQRLYGDRFEPNNSRTEPEDLGTLPAGPMTLTDLSIDDNNDTDFYRFSPAHDGFLCSVVLRPVGASYPEGAQNNDGSCSAGTTFNSLTRHNLNLELRDADGDTVLVSASSTPAGQQENIQVFPLPSGQGPFFLRVFPTTSTNNVQLYELELTLVDPPSPRHLSVSDVIVNEGAGTATLTVAVTPPAGETIEVPWQPSSDTAAAGIDFAPTGGAAVIPAGADSVSITIPVFDDALDENDETFTVQLTAPANAFLADGSATVTIFDDDTLPTLTVATSNTGEASGLPVVFAVTLSAPSGRELRVDWATAASASTLTPAQPSLDYVPTSGTFVLAPGETTGLLGPVHVLDDLLPEADETFDLTLTNPINVTLTAPLATGRIDDDEGPLAIAHTGSFGPPDADGHPVITWDAVVGRRYRVETSSDLLAWTPLPGSATITATQTSISFADTSTDGATRRYYRVVDLPL